MSHVTARAAVATHGPALRTVLDCLTAVDQRALDTFTDAGGLSLVEVVLSRAGLLDRPGHWTVRWDGPADARPAHPVEIREASATAVRLRVQPDAGRPAIDCHLLVFRDKGTPSDVRRLLRTAAAALFAPPVAVPVAAAVETKPVQPNRAVTVTIAPPAKTLAPPPRPTAAEQADDAEVQRLIDDPTHLGLVFNAVGVAAGADTFRRFVRAVAMEFGPTESTERWERRLAALARAGFLVEVRNGAAVAGYAVSKPGWGHLILLEGANRCNC